MSGALSTLESDLLSEVAELREKLARAESRLESDLTAAESTRVAQVAAKDEVIAGLREQLAWHRLPWWRRLRG